MPILPAEPELFPEALFEDSQPVVMGGGGWWILHTRPRQEKSLARQLRESRTPFYLPLISRRMRSRALNSHLPLFPGYVFLLAGGEERLKALATGRVVRPIKVFDQEALWRDLRQVHQLLASGVAVHPEDRLAPGVRVEIQSGPLAGLRGTILRDAGRRRFVVAVDFIQRGASVVLDDFTLTAVAG